MNHPGLNRWTPAFAGVTLLVSLLLPACKHDREPNKLIDGIPVNVTATVIPAQAAQQHLLLTRDLMTIAIPVMNKFEFADSDFNELTPAGGGTYTSRNVDARYGDATFTFSFKNGSGGAIDPVSVRSDSTTFKTMVVAVSGASGLFSYTMNGTITLDTEGLLTSTPRYSGTANFNGTGPASTYALTFTSVNPGTCVFQGLTAGEVSATGSGGAPPQPATIHFFYATNRNMDGTLTWEGNTGTFHVNVTGPGYVNTPEARLLLD